MRKNNPTNDRRKLAILGALGLGLAMAARRRRWQRYAFTQAHSGHALPPMIDAKLGAWHEQAHRKAAGSPAPEPGGPTQV